MLQTGWLKPQNFTVSYFWRLLCAKSLQSCPTLCDPMDYSFSMDKLLCPWDSPSKNTGILVFEFVLNFVLNTGIQEHWLLCYPPGNLPNPRMGSRSLMSPELVQLIQLLSHVRLFVTPWTAACQASLSITNSQSLLRLMDIELVMPSNRLILCHPLLFLPSIFPSIGVAKVQGVSSSHQVAKVLELQL